MSVLRVRAVVARIVAEFRRDHRTLGLLFVVPIVVLALLGWVIRDQEAPPTRLAVVTAPGGAAADRLVESLEQAGDDQLIVSTASEDDARRRLRDHELDAIAVVPAGIGTAPAAIRVTTLGLNPPAEAGHLVRVQSALRSATLALAPPPAAGLLPTIEVDALFGRPADQADALDALAPVFVGYFAYFFVFILTGVSFLRERIGGTLERLLATPVTRAEIVLGYSIGFGIFATIQVGLVLLFTLGVVHVPSIGPLPALSIGLGVASTGSPALAYLLALVLGLGAVSLGIFLSTFARTELQILQFIPIVIVPQGLLGGIFWPVESLPDVLQPIARLLPVTYAVEGLREVMIAGAGLASRTVQLDLAVLAGLGALFVVLAAATIRREIA